RRRQPRRSGYRRQARHHIRRGGARTAKIMTDDVHALNPTPDHDPNSGHNSVPNSEPNSEQGQQAGKQGQQPKLSRIAALLKPYRRQMILVGIAVLVTAGITAIVPFLTRAAFDRGLFPVGGGGPSLRLLAFLVVGLLALSILSSFASIGRNHLTSTTANS